jgi:hypothetical protein
VIDGNGEVIPYDPDDVPDLLEQVLSDIEWDAIEDDRLELHP